MIPYWVRKLILPCADPESEKGRNTFEWHLPDGRQITIYYRKKGEVVGAHYHEGADPSKNPERFVLIAGKVSLHEINQDNDEIAHMVDAKDRGGQPVSLTISPFIFHSFKALTDIIYIEYRVTPFDKNNPDTYTDFTEFKKKVLEK